jgi:Bacterial transcriptional activator domain
VPLDAVDATDGMTGEGSSAEVSFAVLGPLEVRLSGQVITLPAGTRRSLLDAPKGCRDVDVFVDLTARARSAQAAVDPAHGETLALEELRTGAKEDRARALLGLGRTSEAVAALEDLAVRHPLRDGNVGLLVDALHATGRTADAPAVLARHREHLADELGLDPSPAMAERQVRLLPRRPRSSSSGVQPQDERQHGGRSRVPERSRGHGQRPARVGEVVHQQDRTVEVRERLTQGRRDEDLLPHRRQAEGAVAAAGPAGPVAGVGELTQERKAAQGCDVRRDGGDQPRPGA